MVINMIIGIDLLWVRPGICGGTESYIRNLMDGFAKYDSENEYILFVTRDNGESFAHYEAFPRMRLIVCPTDCASQAKRIVWENLHLDRIAREEGVELMFIPVYSKPRTYGSRIPYVSVIHDLQALHYPQFFSKVRRLFLKYMWKYACASSQRVVTISEYCRQDLVAHYPVAADKCSVIYNPVEIKPSRLDDDIIEKKYGLRRGEYFYCVSSMLPHKNLLTLLKVIASAKKAGRSTPLVISGVGGDKSEFDEKVKKLDIGDLVIDTGFVTNEERDWLYENCRLFLFPSVFEGFGMPPVEAMGRGKVVVMSRESCLKEITRGRAIYVDDPFDEDEWAVKISVALKEPACAEDFAVYHPECIAKQYIELFRNVRSGN